MKIEDIEDAALDCALFEIITIIPNCSLHI